MTESHIVRYCAPTLAGLKTGNMFCCTYFSKSDIMEKIRMINQRLIPYGVYTIPFRFSKDRALIYVFRPDRLGRDLGDETARAFLKNRGYESESPKKHLACLMKRMKEDDEFPHEVGLFLGYPPKDVQSFTECRGRGYNCCGNWKAYSDEENANKVFAMYRKCTYLYCKAIENGATLEKLTVKFSTNDTGRISKHKQGRSTT